MIYLKGTGYSVSEEFQHKARELFVLFGGVSKNRMPTKLTNTLR
jgi:hypothetical protein